MSLAEDNLRAASNFANGQMKSFNSHQSDANALLKKLDTLILRLQNYEVGW